MQVVQDVVVDGGLVRCGRVRTHQGSRVAETGVAIRVHAGDIHHLLTRGMGDSNCQTVARLPGVVPVVRDAAEITKIHKFGEMEAQLQLTTIEW